LRELLHNRGVAICAATGRHLWHLLVEMRALLIAVLGGCGFGIGFGDNANRELGVPSTTPDAGPDTPGPVTPDALVEEGPCTLVPQAHCPSGDACDLGTSVGETVCRDVETSGTEDARCIDDVDCAAGFTCSTLAAGIRICERFCNTDANCRGDGARCVLDLDNDVGPPNLKVCSNACDPIDDEGCPSGLGCYAFDGGNADFSSCEVAGVGLPFERCTETTDCGPGSICDNGTCFELCDLDFASCGGSFTCRTTAQPIVIGEVSYGICFF
jgi:hypothetical protein